MYERARPGFPPEAVAHMVERLAIGAGTDVLDLGAGTGKLARVLAETGARVVAVEPLAAMRAKLAELAPGVAALEGTAEEIPLEDSSVDAVVVAQAFHWFRGAEALAEIHRVLRPDGGLALLWNRRDMSDPIQRAFERAIAAHRGDAPAHRSGRWRDAVDATELFDPLAEATFPNVQRLQRDALVGRVASISFVAALPEEARRAVIAEVAALAPDPPATLVFPYVTEVYLTRRR
ncbi:MAG: class I SAM-dependent methyltransferase [Actinobacteria bacterium]|nr:class I SAM-dependent methyltransferase [Actinomycetota bacterium]